MDYDVTITVNVTYGITNCNTSRGCIGRFNIHNYKVDSPQSRSTYRDTRRYSLIGTADTRFIRTTETFEFTLSASERGFYLAFRDEGTCGTINRVIVYRQRCPAQQIGLVVYPEIPSPASGTVEAEASCVENAHAVSDLGLMCDSEGTWTGSPLCSCDAGYKLASNTEGVQFCEGI